ncbi:MAG: class I SAM-dependent methyltransferase [Acidimicrobiia bacterium]|nr:class I SAM-dependent methyltransferase [Acidimicrobiia bacterium]
MIPFYGSKDPAMYAIERAAMDRPGRVIDELRRRLPNSGLVADIGAGDGYTACHLETAERRVIAVEPDAGMIRHDQPRRWLQGVAAALPLDDNSLDAAYATWAYFFARDWDPTPGLGELHRTVRRGGPLLIVDNLGDDEFSSLTDRDMAADTVFWSANGFETSIIDTAFEFETIEDARRLLGFYFGERGREGARLSVGYRVGLFAGHSRGVS